MFKGYRLVKDGDGYTVILFIDENDTEFAAEFGSKDPQNKEQANEKITSWIKRNVGNIKVKSVKIMVGATLLTTLAMNMETPQASAHQIDFNMSYLYFGSTQSFIKQVENTKGNVNVTAPSYFDINPDGSLKLTTLVDPNFVNEMHNKNIKVVPFLSNHWDRQLGREALENREQLAQEIADVVNEYNLDGINVDIENVTHEDRENYTDFVRLLREKIPKDKEVSVAVAANPNGWTKGWHGSYDYKALSQHADYLMIMAYDQSYEGGPEGPVASYNWVEKSIQYSLNQGVPDEKIVLGLPFFGRYWIEGESSGGRGISNVRVEELVKKYNGTVVYDEAAKSPKATVTIKPEDPVTTIAGKALNPGTYTIWFENNESITRKMDLVHKYNLKGTGSWSLGQEDPSLWYKFDTYLKNHDYQLNTPTPAPEQTPETVPEKQEQTDTNNNDAIPTPNPIFFRDIDDHWAKNDIRKIAEKGWMKGVGNDNFGAEQSLTRAQAAAILVRALELQPLQPITDSSQSFGDVENGYWAQKEIEIINQHGFMTGKAKGQFAPDDIVTREEMAAILDRIIDVSPSLVTESTYFTDISSSRWSYDAIEKMNKQGIFKGYSDHTFKPLEKVTRGQMASILSRISPLLEKETATMLKAGASGAEVKSLQSDLAFLGYFDETITGYFGKVTDEAVRAFQQDHQLSVDGIVGPNTLEKIKEEVNKKTENQQ